MSKRTVRQYDDTFKERSVALYYDSGKSLKRLSQDLNIPSATLAGWVNGGKYVKGNARHSSQATEQELAQMHDLRKALRIVTEERDILKKAVAIFSEKPNR